MAELLNKRICTEIEGALHRSMRSRGDFDYLRERIYARTHQLVSSTTLMRLWGYLDEDVNPRESTLSILSQFIGYRDWQDYKQNAMLPKELQSSPVLSRRLSPANELKAGDRIRLTWQPDRVCDIEYLGNLSFRVITSVNTRLREQDTFQCSLIIEGEPLFLDNLRQNEAPPIAYVCGKKTGVMFEYL